MSDSEQSSSEEDEDYVPEEYDSDEEDSGDQTKKRHEKNIDNEKERITKELGEEEIAAKKAKEEQLWASFKKDTGTMPQKSSKPAASQIPSSSSKKVSITKTYDFAGESVIVTKTVDVDSTEAKKMKNEETKTSEAATKQLPSSVGLKRHGGLSSVLGQISKKTKMSTLEKSKLDWNTFKDQEGIREELQHFNKDGYLEKQAFLQRTDERQFENERDIRQGTRKR